VIRAVRPLVARRRHAPRERVVRPVRLVAGPRSAWALALDRSGGGMGLLVVGAAPAAGSPLPVVAREGVTWARVAHARRVLPGVWRVGLAFLPEPLAVARPHAYLAA
jgi:cellulose synthase (UDP-forming)